MFLAGYSIHPTKCRFEPSREARSLGFIVQTSADQWRFSVAPERLASIVASAAEVVAWPAAVPMPARALRSLLGKVVSLHLAAPALKCLLHSSFSLLAQFQDGRSPSILIPAAVREDLAELTMERCELAIRMARWRPEAHSQLALSVRQFTVHTDAAGGLAESGAGWGGVIRPLGGHPLVATASPAVAGAPLAPPASPASLTLEFQGVFPPEVRSRIIAVKEAWAALYTLQATGSRLDHSFVDLFVDNQNVFYALRRSYARSPNMAPILKAILNWCMHHDVALNVAWIPSAQNDTADRLSRSARSAEHTLSSTLFEAVQARAGRVFTLDLCASLLNRRTTRFVAWGLSDADAAGTALVATSCFAADLSFVGEFVWAHPPRSCIGALWAHLHSRGAQGVLLAPRDESRDWLASLRMTCSRFWCVATAGARGVLWLPPVSPGGRWSRAPPLDFDLWAFQFDFRTRVL
jgi:hypothetical protein